MQAPAPGPGPGPWHALPCARSELRLDLVLSCGQAFRWRERSAGHWTGELGGRVWTLRQTEEQLWFTVHAGPDPDPEPDPGRILRDYFQLDVPLAPLYAAWAAADPRFQRAAAACPGVRVLRQDPLECLVAFICSANNRLPRIAAMLQRLCRAFGRRLARLGRQPYHAFPSLQALAGPGVEARLRELGFGYRARFVSGAARAVLQDLGAEGLARLRGAPYAEARRVLCSLPGVGAKVADCVCLMALDKPEAVPVDTHVWQVARQRYGLEPGAAARSLTPRVYRETGDFFRRLWGPRAGWAQAVLFCAEVTRPRGALPCASPSPKRGRARRSRSSCLGPP
ncbi:N-glycosylase/DNA lyase isoform X2 [Alligator mississippiensis]|uniref:N-glycosylase/DNA lyase isoform X2 n=1 Tax=Alligator mississippiensis TaxID=8496 RepID=UPI0028781548|nr:N-glycosylase/DNA lyase isoform X2 [Alligator mississippiensis]